MNKRMGLRLDRLREGGRERARKRWMEEEVEAEMKVPRGYHFILTSNATKDGWEEIGKI